MRHLYGIALMLLLVASSCLSAAASVLPELVSATGLRLAPLADNVAVALVWLYTVFGATLLAGLSQTNYVAKAAKVAPTHPVMRSLHRLGTAVTASAFVLAGFWWMLVGLGFFTFSEAVYRHAVKAEREKMEPKL